MNRLTHMKTATATLQAGRLAGGGFRAVLMAVMGAIVVAPIRAEVTPIAHYNLSGAGGIRDTACPEILKDQSGNGPDLTRQGAPKVMTHAPEARRQEYGSAIMFQEPDQCYSVARNLAGGDNFVIEAWAYALKADDGGWHTVVANGDGGRGFILGQNGAHWEALVGGVGATQIAPVVPETWTHLALVKSGGTVSAWHNGKRVANNLPNIGGGVANFSIGATAPNREPFNGWIAEVRLSSFQQGKFDPATDFLLDQKKMKELQTEERKGRIKLIESLTKAPGVAVVEKFDEKPYGADWLIKPPATASSVQVLPAADGLSAQVMLANGLVSRTFLVTDNLGCVSFRRSDHDIEFVRAVKPEVRVMLDGTWQNIGGLTGVPDRGFLTQAWYEFMESVPGAWVFSRMIVGPCVKPYHWQPKNNAPENIAWPPKGIRVTLRHIAPDNPLLAVDVHYEIYDGLPVMMKSFTFHNKTGETRVVTRFEGEHLAVQPTVSRLMHVESDYSCGMFNFTELSSGLGIHARGERERFREYYLGGGTTRFIRDPDWGSMATLNPAEDIFLDNPENALLLSLPPTGPNWTVPAGESFDAFRTFTILNDEPRGTERAFLAQRRFYRVLAPQTNEKMFELHAPHSSDVASLKEGIDQMAEAGFHFLQAPEHPGGIEYSDLRTIERMKPLCDYARTKGILVGGYELAFASRGRDHKHNCIDPSTGRPGSPFGQSVCVASEWADLYFENMWEVIEASGMGGWKPDGPYHGCPCASTEHKHHKGLEDSQWAQWLWQCKVLAEGQRRNLWMTIPDYYFLNGQPVTGMGYREATDNIDIVLQTVLYRQYIFDATFHKTAQMGWCNLNTEVLRGGMEANLDRYERMFFTLLSSGAQVWVRGHRLWDGPKSREMILKWMDWYRKYEKIILGDIIHLRRPDGRGLDYYLHVNPHNREKGMLLVFNPLDTEASKTIDLPLYYTGLSDTARIRPEEGPAQTHKLDRQYKVKFPVTLPPGAFTWFIIE